MPCRRAGDLAWSLVQETCRRARWPVQVGGDTQGLRQFLDSGMMGSLSGCFSCPHFAISLSASQMLRRCFLLSLHVAYINGCSWATINMDSMFIFHHEDETEMLEHGAVTQEWRGPTHHLLAVHFKSLLGHWALAFSAGSTRASISEGSSRRLIGVKQ